MGSRLLAARNLLKVWTLLIGLCAALGGIGWVLDGYRLMSIFIFSGLLLGAAVYWYADRAALLQSAPPAELEGVLAHEMAHIRHRDVLVQSVASLTAAVIVETSRVGG